MNQTRQSQLVRPTPRALGPGPGASASGSPSQLTALALQNTHGNAWVQGTLARCHAPEVMDEATSGVPESLPYRAEMEAYFGEDFSGVGVHTGEADLMGRLGANAAAQEDRVAFASPSPSRELVAHELTHIVQQRHAEGGGAGGAVSRTTDAAEGEADQVAARIGRGETAEVSAAPSAEVHLDDNVCGGDAAADWEQEVVDQKAEEDAYEAEWRRTVDESRRREHEEARNRDIETLGHAALATEGITAPLETAAELLDASEGSALSNASRGAGAMFGPVQTVLGGAEMVNGIQNIREGNTEEGVHELVSGGCSTAGGAGTTATALLGEGAVAPWVAELGPVAAAGGAGFAAGTEADELARESQLVQRSTTVQGQGLTGEGQTQERDLGLSDWLTEEMQEARVATGSDAGALALGGVMAIGAPIGWALDALTDGASSGHGHTETIEEREQEAAAAAARQRAWRTAHPDGQGTWIDRHR